MLGHPKSMQCNFNSCSFNYKSDYSLAFYLHCKAIAALFFIPYCSLIWGPWLVFLLLVHGLCTFCTYLEMDLFFNLHNFIVFNLWFDLISKVYRTYMFYSIRPKKIDSMSQHPAPRALHLKSESARSATCWRCVFLFFYLFFLLDTLPFKGNLIHLFALFFMHYDVRVKISAQSMWHQLNFTLKRIWKKYINNIA